MSIGDQCEAERVCISLSEELWNGGCHIRGFALWSCFTHYTHGVHVLASNGGLGVGFVYENQQFYATQQIAFL